MVYEILATYTVTVCCSGSKSVRKYSPEGCNCLAVSQARDPRNTSVLVTLIQRVWDGTQKFLCWFKSRYSMDLNMCSSRHESICLTQMNVPTKKKQTPRQGGQTGGCKGGVGGVECGMDWESEESRCPLFHLEWIGREVLHTALGTISNLLG